MILSLLLDSVIEFVTVSIEYRINGLDLANIRIGKISDEKQNVTFPSIESTKGKYVKTFLLNKTKQMYSPILYNSS